jgi:hypothetical protein
MGGLDVFLVAFCVGIFSTLMVRIILVDIPARFYKGEPSGAQQPKTWVRNEIWCRGYCQNLQPFRQTCYRDCMDTEFTK